MDSATDGPNRTPSQLALAVAFALIYLSWGTTYLAIRVGVQSFPPALFGGTRISLAGILLLSFLALRGERLRIPASEIIWLFLVSMLLFVGGNGLITWAEKTVPSGIASVLVATTPLFVGLIELFWPHGERLNLMGWLGLLVGMAGVVLLLVPRLRQVDAFTDDIGPFLILGSAFTWALGSVFVRMRREHLASFVGVSYQMILGGSSLIVIGLCAGETNAITRDSFQAGAIYSFFHLLIFGSLIGFLAYNWLLRHVSAAMVGTYAYVNPVVALLLGWLLSGEEITSWVLGGMAFVLAGVALVRGSTMQPAAGAEEEASPEPLAVEAGVEV